MTLLFAAAQREPISKASQADIEALAAKLEPALDRAIRDMLTEHAGRVSLDDLEAALTAGDRRRVIEMIGALDPAAAARVKAELEDLTWEGGALAVRTEFVLRGAEFGFNRLNPALVQWLEGYTFDLIREIDRQTMQSVQAALIKGMTAGANPIEQAREIKASVGLTQKQAQAAANFRRALGTFHERRSAKRWGLGNTRSRLSGVAVMPLDANGKPKDGIEQWRLRDQRYDAALKRAMESGKPLTPEQIDKMTARYVERAIQNRARAIARTESIRALNAGVHEAWRQAIAAGQVDGRYVRKMWRVALDERTCPVCTSIPKANPKRGVPLDARFTVPKHEPIAAPPQHPNCRCSIQVRLWEPSQLKE